MGKSELQTSTNYWAQRIPKYIQAGIPQAVWQPIATKDMQNTYALGSAPMTNQDADVAVYSAWKGNAAVAQQPAHHGGVLGGLENVLGNVTSDVGGIITGAPRGVATLAKEVVTPSSYTSAGKDLGQALKDVTDPGRALRDVQSSKLLDLIPGVDVAAKLTTGAGRASLEQHPVSALLDVLPVTKPLSAVAGAGLAAGAGGALGEALSGATLADKLRGVDVRAGDPSALAALAAGRPVQALARAADQSVLSRLPGVAGSETATQARALGLGVGQQAIRKALSRAQLDQAGRSLSRVLNQAQLTGEQQAHDFTAGQLADTFRELGSTDRKGRWAPDNAAIESFTQKAVTGDTASMSPAELATYDKVQNLMLDMRRPALERGELVDVPGLGVYARDSQVVAKHRTVVRRQARLDKERSAMVDGYAKNLYQAADRLSRAERTALTRRRQLSTAIARAPAPGLPRGAALSPDWVETGRTAQAAHTLAVDRAKTAKADYDRLVAVGPTSASYDTAKAGLQKANDALDKQLVKEPPTHLHPLIEANLRKRVSDAVTRQAERGGALEDHIDTAGSGRLRTMGSLQAALKEISTTPMLDRLEEYVGKPEFKAMLADSVHTALKLQAEGLAPLYMHKVGRSELDDIARVHVARTSDVREDQLRHRLFNVGSTVMNLQAALTSQAVNTIERDGMQHVYDSMLSKVEQTKAQLEPTYQQAAQRLKQRGKLAPGRNWETLMEREWVRFDFDRFGVRRHQSGPGASSDVYIPKDLARNLESASGGGRAASMFANTGYQKVMRVFRVSVLYGPRHFAHVVIGGVMAPLLDSPSSILEWPRAWQVAHEITKGRPFTGEVAGIPIPAAITSHFDYREDTATKYMNQAVGSKLGTMLKDFWEKTGAKPGDAMARWEEAAQTLYQTGVYLRDIKKSRDPMVALEHARRLVVNLDELSPFERTVMKQVMPFYSFTRFATAFLTRLPFDHPLRVAILSRLSNQAQEEWGTGLPLTMMSLFFFGHPKAGGNQWTVNLRNMNPFRSLSNQFTLAGFVSSLNPLLTAPFQALGYNPLQGQQLYPEITYNPTTGSLVAAAPKGGALTAAEAFIPELGVLDMYKGISDNFRSLKQAGDHSAQMRELMNLLNIPFAVSQYNPSQVRGRVAKDQLEAARNAVTQFEKTGDYAGTIGRYNLIPYQGQLVQPGNFLNYWRALSAQYAQQYPGASTKAVMPTVTTPKVDTLAALLAQAPQ